MSKKGDEKGKEYVIRIIMVQYNTYWTVKHIRENSYKSW